jgi:hypothetical protein
MKKFIVKKNGLSYLVVGKRAIPFDKTDASGKPIIKVETEEKINENGGKDVTVKVPSLKVLTENKEIK